MATHADLTLDLKDGAGAVVATTRSSSGTASLAYQAATGGSYTLVLRNNSTDVAVPSFTATTRVPKYHYATATLALKDAAGAVVAENTSASRPKSISANVTPGDYTLVVTPKTGTGRAALTATYPGRPLREVITYDAHDHVTSIDDGTVKIEETLSPSGRVLRRRVKDSTTGALKEDTLVGYDGAGDSPAYMRPAAGGAVTTYLPGPSGVGAIYTGTTVQYPLANGHSDVVAHTDAAGAFTAQASTDEFGRGDASPGRLGWLGAHQRFSTGDNLGLVRMGVRLYDPSLGRFLQRDPVEGGCSNDYAYVFGDPINDTDLSGRLSRKQCRQVFSELWQKITSRKGLYYRATHRARYRDADAGHIQAFEDEQRRVIKVIDRWDKGGCDGRNWPGGTAASITLARDLATMPDPGTTGDPVPSLRGIRRSLSWWSWTSAVSGGEDGLGIHPTTT